MPRLNRDGRVLAGIAGIPASIDHVLIPRALGGWQWLTTNNAAGQYCGANDAGGESCEMRTQQGNILVNEGAYWFAAGGGRWTSFLTTIRSNFGVTSSTPGLERAIPVHASFDGDVGFITNYGEGHGITIYRNDGAIVRLDTPLGYTWPITLRDGIVTWLSSDGGWRVFDYRAMKEVPFVRLNDADYVVGARAGADVILVERLSNGADLRVRRASASSGVIAGAYQGMGRETYNPDIVTLGSSWKIAWSFTKGEYIHEYTTNAGTIASLPAGGAPSTIPDRPVQATIDGGSAVAPASDSVFPLAVAAGVGIALYLVRRQ